MKHVITNAAEITILEVIDNTFKTGGGPASVGGTVIMASKGPVGVVTKVLSTDWQDIFGKPLTKKTASMEGLRHLSEAAKECNYVNVVRCVASDAKFPVLTYAPDLTAYQGEWAVSTTYAVSDIVSHPTVVGVLLRCVAAHTTAVDADEPEADGSDTEWETLNVRTYKAVWAVSTAYVVGDVVSRSSGNVLLRCVEAHTTASDATEPAADGSDDEWEVYDYVYIDDWATATAYVVDNLISLAADATVLLRCVVAHTSSGSEPAAAGTSTEWEVYSPSYAIPSAEAYGSTIAAGTTDMMKFYPIDGDPSVNRKLKIQNIDTTNERFDVVVEDVNELGATVEIEKLTVSVDVDGKDDMGAPNYIETAFENQSTAFRVDWNESLAWADVLVSLQALEDTTATPKSSAFVGGTNGGTPTTLNWTDAWSLFSNENVSVNMLFAAGNYVAAVVSHMGDIAHARHCASFADAPPYLAHAAAITWLTNAGISNRHLRVYYSPFQSSDIWRGGKTIWGASGAAVAAKAKGNAIFTGSTPGVHYAPAGPKRGLLNRTGMKTVFPDDIIDRDELYTIRINPVVALQSGGAMIDDDLTTYSLQNYSRFGWVNDILDYIDHRFLEAASYAKFEPDGLTKKILTDRTTKILEDLVTSGALVSPRVPEQDGTKPYVLTIEQTEIDLWRAQWDVCPTGAARRIAGQPRLIR